MIQGKEDIRYAVAEDIMIPLNRLVTLDPDMDALVALRLLLKHRISGAPVVDRHNQYLGVFSEKTSMDFLVRMTYDALPSNTVKLFMNTEQERTICPSSDLLSIVEKFRSTPYRRLPVLAGTELVGQISRRDVLTEAAKMLKTDARPPRSRSLYLSTIRTRPEHI